MTTTHQSPRGRSRYGRSLSAFGFLASRDCLGDFACSENVVVFADAGEDDGEIVIRRSKEDVMESVALLDCAGRRRSPATIPSFHRGLSPRNKGLHYPPDPPTVEEIIAVMRAAGTGPEGVRLRAIIVVLWRSGLRISEALALNETDLDADRGSLVVRHGKGDKRREVGMDRWGWTHLDPWLELRRDLPVGRLFCVVRGPTLGRPCATAGIRAQLHRTAAMAGVRRRFAPHH
ncbi:MAG: tyrosine-type recombinase/integrase [Solirubrobacteraceae bacterium]